MSLIKCPECGKEVSDTIHRCIHCGYDLKKEIAREKMYSDSEQEDGKFRNNKKFVINKLKTLTKKQIAIIVFIIGFLLFVPFLTKSKYERTADKYITELKEIYDIKEINAVFCIKDSQDNDEYVIFYKTNFKYDYAFFDHSGEYIGNGENGGTSNTKDGINNNNFMAKYNEKKAFDLFLEEFDHNNFDDHIKKELKNNSELVYVEFDGFLDWIDGNIK